MQLKERYESFHQCTLVDALVMRPKPRIPKRLIVISSFLFLVNISVIVLFEASYGWLLVAVLLTALSAGLFAWVESKTAVLITRNGFAYQRGAVFMTMLYHDIRKVTVNDTHKLYIESPTKSVTLHLQHYPTACEGLITIVQAYGFLEHKPYEHNIYFHDDAVVVEPALQSQNDTFKNFEKTHRTHHYVHRGDLEGLEIDAALIREFKHMAKTHGLFRFESVLMKGSHPLNTAFIDQQTDSIEIVFTHFTLLSLKLDDEVFTTLKALRQYVPQARVKSLMHSFAEGLKTAHLLIETEHGLLDCVFTFDEVFMAFNALEKDPWVQG